MHTDFTLMILVLKNITIFMVYRIIEHRDTSKRLEKG